MDEARLRFLFGSIPADDAVASEDGRDELLRADRPEPDVPPAIPLLRLVVANQILDDDPPLTWITARRLLDGGLERHEVMDHLVQVLGPFVERAVRGEQPVDDAGYAEALEEMPAPVPVAVLEAYVETVREHGTIAAETLEGLLAARLGLDPADPATERLLGDCELAILGDRSAPVTMLAPDLVVHVPALAEGIVLTHRLSGAEQADEHLEIGADLAGFLRCPTPRVARGPLHVDDGEPVLWGGPQGWLAEFPEDALLAVRVVADGEATVAALDAAPSAPPELVAAVRGAYDAEYEDAELPVDAETLLLALLHRDGSAFAEPRPPLSELAAAAGLERRGNEFAHDAAAWARADEADRQFRLVTAVDSAEQGDAAVEAHLLLAGRPTDPAVLRRTLDLLADPQVLLAVTEDLLEPEDPERVRAAVGLADRLVAAAGSSPRAAVAHWVATIAAERDGRVLDAESHLRSAAVAADGWALVEDRLAWYESDRGAAASALGRWRAIDLPDDDPDVAALLPFAAAAAPEPGRNEPCWCGSGRKYKQCHLGSPAAAPLSERADWLQRKAAAYLERRGGAAEAALAHCAEAIAGAGEDIEDVLVDPLVVDAVLHEGGWFARFLADRGPLLPADEAELAQTWSAVERSVHEVVGIRFGAGLTVRDLRTGDEIAITHPTAARTVGAGELLCGRAVPDGAGHRFTGAVMGVPRGRERALLALLAERDALALLVWMEEASAELLLG